MQKGRQLVKHFHRLEIAGFVINALLAQSNLLAFLCVNLMLHRLFQFPKVLQGLKF